MKAFNTGLALIKQLPRLKATKSRLIKLAKEIDWINDLSLAQYAQLFITATEFNPDLIIEVGRGFGNSTAVLTEAANQLKKTKVYSICLTSDWKLKTSPKLDNFLPKEWFLKLDAQIVNVFDVNFKKLVKDKKRILFFWDAHGWDVAELMLGKVLPLLQKKEHLILVHDISFFDSSSPSAKYGDKGIWKGYPGDEVKDLPYVTLGTISSPFEEVIALVDFASRNSIKIKSVQEEINQILKSDQEFEKKFKELGKEMAQSASSIHYFSLNDSPENKEIYFPKVIKKSRPIVKTPSISFANTNTKADLIGRPLVSIITPSFNSGKFLEECIQSVLNQDYPYVEHIIQDGGSKDRTLKILKKYSTPKYKNKVKWISNPDKGQSDGLDKAIKLATGEVILVLNADDVLLPYACSWGVLHLKLNPDVAVVYGDEYIIDETGKIIHEYTGPRYEYEKLLCVEIVPAAQTAFIRRSYFEQVGLGADSTLSTCPDYEMWVRIGARFSMKYSPGFVCKYRWHTGSEGQQPSMILKMVEAKKQVMNRVFNDKKTPKRIKKLRKRAYAGVEIWGAINNMQLRGPVPITAKLVISSFLNYPPNIAKYRKLIPGGVISFTKFAFMHIIKDSPQLKKLK